MKLFGLMLFVFSLNSAFAQEQNWTIQKCSNSDGTVAWESSHDQNEIRLKYSNFIEGVLNLDLAQVQISHHETKILDDKVAKNCAQEYKRKVFAGKVVITPATTHPEVLLSHFPENKVYTEVICTEISVRDIPCVRK